MATVPRPLYVLSCDVECCHSVCEFYWGVTFVRVISRLLQCPSVFYRNIDSMEKQQPLPNHRVYKLVLTGGKQPGKRYCGKFARALSISMKINKNTCLPPLKTNEWLPPYHITSGTRLNLRVINCIRILSTWHGDSLISDPWSINQPSTSWLQIIAMSPISCIQLTDSSREDDVVVGSGLDRGAVVSVCPERIRIFRTSSRHGSPSILLSHPILYIFSYITWVGFSRWSAKWWSHAN